jgi:hypothetical protein
VWETAPARLPLGVFGRETWGLELGLSRRDLAAAKHGRIVNATSTVKGDWLSKS